MTSILISRFLIHLQSVNERVICIGSHSRRIHTSDSTIVFKSMIGSIGTSLVPDDYFMSADDEAGSIGLHVELPNQSG